jgi:hypothetical protein
LAGETGNAKFSIGVLRFGTIANREIGVPGARSEFAAAYFTQTHFSKLEHYPGLRTVLPWKFSQSFPN